MAGNAGSDEGVDGGETVDGKKKRGEDCAKRGLGDAVKKSM